MAEVLPVSESDHFREFSDVKSMKFVSDRLLGDFPS